jgi:hypothetical protein
MSEFENEGGADFDDLEAAGRDAAVKPSREHRERDREPVSFGTMATRNLQRARKLLAEGDSPASADYFIRSATVMAILELADSVRTSAKST